MMEKYKYPKTIQIGGHTYKVFFKDAATVDDAGKNYADSCQATLEIRVALKTVEGAIRPTSSIEAVFWHEILHQIDRIYAAEDTLHEGDIDRLAEGLFQVLNQLDWHIVKETE